MRKRSAATVVSITRGKTVCNECELVRACPFGAPSGPIAGADRLNKRYRQLKKGELVYRFGDPLRALYAVRSGTIKTTGLMEDGRVQVTGFHLPGGILGIDAISTNAHPCSAEALEVSEICEIPYPELEAVAQEVQGLPHELLRMMSREIVRDEQLVMMLGRMTAEERLASCLLCFSRHQARLGLSETELRLVMSRQELGDYLGLALETVSRLFSRMQEEGLLSVQGRHVRLHDLARLQTMAGGSCGEQSIPA
jgi:CRP/FNR family transcriptional regulator, anaerobic regulatory protein